MPVAQIVFVGPVPPLCSGTAQHATRLVEALGEEAEVTVLSWQHQYPRLLFRRAQRNAVCGHLAGARFGLRWWDPLSWWRAGSIAARSDLVVLAWTTPFHALPYRVILALAGRGGARRVAVVHNAVPHEPLPWHQQLTRWTLAACDGAVTHARSVADDLARMIPELETVVVAHPPNLDIACCPLPEADPPRLVLLGFVRRYKGLDVALHALALLAARGLRPELTVAGEFWEPVGRWRDRANELGLDGQVTLQPGYLDDAQVTRLLYEHHAVLLPYRSASSSGILPLALAAGRPAIGSAVGGIEEVIVDGVNGTLATPGDPVSLAAAIERALADLPDLAAGTGRASSTWDAVARAVRKFGPDY